MPGGGGGGGFSALKGSVPHGFFFAFSSLMGGVEFVSVPHSAVSHAQLGHGWVSLHVHVSDDDVCAV